MAKIPEKMFQITNEFFKSDRNMTNLRTPIEQCISLLSDMRRLVVFDARSQTIGNTFGSQ